MMCNVGKIVFDFFVSLCVGVFVVILFICFLFDLRWLGSGVFVCDIQFPLLLGWVLFIHSWWSLYILLMSGNTWLVL